mmetsp:Transcript_23518/g.39181  ORF Transcript_23518/g.39181 Transcript_23518/m.39181 type:complete len:749 (+) Transcript_23518:92-2338(+)
MKSGVTTKKGKNRDQYGRKFGKKHGDAMFEFTKTLWLQDSTSSLKNLLEQEVAQNEFMKFLGAEYGEAQLEFYLEVQKMEKMDPSQQPAAAQKIYDQFVNTNGKGIGQQERTAATQDLWDSANSSNGAPIEATFAMRKVREEAETTLKMLAFDAFPRFVKSPGCAAVLSAIKSQGGNAEVEGMLNSAGNKVPQDADDWLNIFVATAESFPACIVISDMTIPGAPMVYVNKEFCKTTGYAKEEATGRNCRFLQGPETEPEAIQVIRNTLSKGQDCHVKLTNYRKNGEKFQNLLSMKPIFDADNIYRFVIGVQFEVKEDDNLKARLVQLDKLLRLLPSKLNLRSKASSRAKGALAVKVTGEANQMIANKEQVLQQAKQMDQQEQNSNRPKAIVAQAFEQPMGQMNLDNTVFGFTKIMWLNCAPDVMQAVLLDPLGKEMLGHFIRTTSIVYQNHFDFLCKFMMIASAQGQEQVRLIRKFHMKRNKNSLFYCTATEINYGTLNQMNWGPVFQEMQARSQTSLAMFTADIFPKFMNSKFGHALVMKVRAREVSGQQAQLRTVACGLDKNAETFWLDMFRVMSETCTVGVVVSDMTVPGIPLSHINEGFKTVTGYGKEKIGCSCRFLQGPETEDYLNDEIMAALQQSEPLLLKLHNYKADGTKFQCLFALHPVFGPAPDNEYKYQIGIQLDFNPADPDLARKVAELARVIRFLPQTVGGEELPGVSKAVADYEALASVSGGGGGGMGGGMGGFM